MILAKAIETKKILKHHQEIKFAGCEEVFRAREPQGKCTG
jgi:hypothetical protein